ncbi:MAG: hypothetical protein CYG61_09545 [Actinobacteria bacterium]|jgi:hypothetical protein|nr:MAG: hypothetical protein CYG61_09545 [Actinomycetota bacterium]
MEPTGYDLVEFWNFASSKGLMNKETAGAWRVACKTVLATVEPETWEKLDLEELNVDAFLQRFERLRMGDLKPNSLRVYQSRFKSALAGYTGYLNSPSTWQFQTTKQGSRSDADSGARRKGRPAPKEVQETAPSAPNNGSSPASFVAGGVQMITHQVPLRRDLIIPLNLPADLTTADVTRLTRFLEAVAFDVQLALPPGRTDQEESEQ